jgi:hypothetical protein
MGRIMMGQKELRLSHLITGWINGLTDNSKNKVLPMFYPAEIGHA